MVLAMDSRHKESNAPSPSNLVVVQEMVFGASWFVSLVEVSPLSIL